MRSKASIFILCCVAIFSLAALIFIFAVKEIEAAPIAANGKQTDRIRLVTDQSAGVVRIVIDGKEVARFTADGLQVRDAIEYGGTITDTGTAYFDHRTGGSGAP